MSTTHRRAATQASTAAPARRPAPDARPAPPRPDGFRGSPGWGLLRALRPHQWIKNVLVLAAPLAAGKIADPDVLGPTAIAFVLFCAVSSGIYLINDSLDVVEDRAHPRKRFRPIAAGLVPRPLAVGVAVVLLVGGLAAAVWLTRPALAAVLGSYVVIQLGYCLYLKHQPVIDLAVVSSGFLLRAVAGGVAAGLFLSQWFLLVAGFGSLFMVAGKRYSELVLVGDAATTRATLAEYSAGYLRFVWGMAASVTVVVYSLWAFQTFARDGGVPWATLSIAPFVLGILRYAMAIDRGTAGAPEEMVLRDPVLLALGALWALTVGAAVLGA